MERCKKHQASTIVLVPFLLLYVALITELTLVKVKNLFAAKLSNFNGIPSHDTFNRFLGIRSFKI